MSTSPITQRQQGLLDVVEIRAPQAALTASLQGAQLLGWTPAGAHPVLYMSPRSLFSPGKAIRGGIPLCFPWFGMRSDNPSAPQHGFARNRVWKLDQATAHADGAAHLAFSLDAETPLHPLWPHKFVAHLKIRADSTLTVELEVVNTDPSPFTFGAALHTYLAVSDVRSVVLHGLENSGYLDSAAGTPPPSRRQGQVPLTFTSETNRVYFDTASTCRLDDPAWKRRIVIEKSGSNSTVVWNPWSERAATMADIGAENWTGFLCVETANAGADSVTLEPQARHTLRAHFRIEPL